MPFVSILTPTFNRRKFFPQYLRNIRRQDYQGPIEILIADDGDDKMEDLIPNDISFRYIKLDQKKTIGYKRNLLCHEAKGDILIHMDDDDFYPSQRISHAVEKLSHGEACIAGASHCYLYSKHHGVTEFGPVGRFHATAGTFAFYKEYSISNQFDEFTSFGEEKSFTRNFTNPLIQLDALKTILVICHDNNTVSKAKVSRRAVDLSLKSFVENITEYDFYMSEL